MNVMNPLIDCLNAPSFSLPEFRTKAATRRTLAYWGGTFVILHVLIGYCLLNPPAILKPFFPQVWWELLAAKSIELTILALLVPILLVRDGFTLSDVGFGSARWKPEVRLGILGGAAIWFMHHSLLRLAEVGTGGVEINTGMTSIVSSLSDAPVELIGLLLGTVIVGPLLEEVVYRGCLMSSSRANLGMASLPAAVIAVSSGLIFSALHGLGHPAYYAVYFVTGVAFALFYRKTGSLAASFAAHAAVNAICSVRIGMQICGFH